MIYACCGMITIMARARSRSKVSRSTPVKPRLVRSVRKSSADLERELADALARQIVYGDPGVGYDADSAWDLASSPGGGDVVSLRGGGYAVTLTKSRAIAPPSKTVPVLARIPGGTVKILPGGGEWRIVGRVADGSPASHRAGGRRQIFR